MAREHNAVCDALRKEYPDSSSEDRIYQIARLVVSALIAKIHTVEWTPAVLATKTARRRHEHQLERGPAGQAHRVGGPDVRPGRRRRHRRLAAGPPRRPVLADRGVRDRLPDAPADPGRLHVRRPHRDPAGGATRLHRDPGRGYRGRAQRIGLVQLALLAGHRPPGRGHAAQLPADAARLRARRGDHRPGRGRHRAYPGARGAALQRLPGRPAPAPHQADARTSPTTRRRCAGSASSTSRSTRSTPWSGCSPRRRRRGSRSATPRSGSSC